MTGLTKSLRDVPKEERPAAGKTINEFKVWVEGQYQAASAEIEKAELAARNKAEAVDITLPGTHHATGALHPITQIKNEIIDVFAGMGFEIYEGPEIEDDDHNFTRLNVPKTTRPAICRIPSMWRMTLFFAPRPAAARSV